MGVNAILGNTAVKDMQGTTRAIYDIVQAEGNRATFFETVSSRQYPFTNISQNRFEVGETLAIESIALLWLEEGLNGNDNSIQHPFVTLGANPSMNLDFYIGNQRVLKNLDLSYMVNGLGNTNPGQIATIDTNFQAPAVFRLETPLVIVPQVEFYATLQFPESVDTSTFALILQGTGTLLNTQNNF
jgi:hypothetical protein